MLLFWLLGPYAADAAINLCNCVYLCLLWPYTTSPARGGSLGSPIGCDSDSESGGWSLTWNHQCRCPSLLGHDKAFQCEMDVCADGAVLLYAIFWSKIGCFVVGFISLRGECELSSRSSCVATLGTVELGTWIEAISFRSLQSFKRLREIGQKRYICYEIIN